MFASIKQALDGAGLTPRQVRPPRNRPPRGWGGPLVRGLCLPGGRPAGPACTRRFSLHALFDKWPVCANDASSRRLCMHVGSICVSAACRCRLWSACNGQHTAALHFCAVGACALMRAPCAAVAGGHPDYQLLAVQSGRCPTLNPGAPRRRAGGHPDRQLLAVQPDAVAVGHDRQPLQDGVQRRVVQPQRHGLQRGRDLGQPRARAVAGAPRRGGWVGGQTLPAAQRRLVAAVAGVGRSARACADGPAFGACARACTCSDRSYCALQ